MQLPDHTSVLGYQIFWNGQCLNDLQVPTLICLGTSTTGLYATVSYFKNHKAFWLVVNLILFRLQSSLYCKMQWSFRALDKREYLMIIEGYFFLFLIETICCDPSSEPF